ncbi:MAG: alkaline phosphatase D family protein [Cytophagales bacterium]|nr:alkaline phosphatase D family protein [Cytophagales bacterium]
MINRRELIRLTIASAALQALSHKAYSQIVFNDNPFQLGVASGAPTSSGVVLWTKLVSSQMLAWGDQPMNVTWQIAHDEQFERMALQGTATALPQLGYAVHAELRGLQADRWYFYRFIVGSGASAQISAVGRTRTAPEPRAKRDKLRFAFASCQNWEVGHYAAYRQMAADNPDLVVFLGDYIYEGRGFGTSARRPPESIVRPHSLQAAITLADYRDRYALYKSDPLLQAAHAACPWLVTWDDHEVENDYANDRGEVLTSPSEFLARRAAAYQAFYEHMPLPASALARGLAGLSRSGSNDGVRVHQRVAWGQLAQFHVLDCRQFRDYQVCTKPNRAGSNLVLPAQCPELADPNRTMLGKPQEAWLAEGLALDAKQDKASQPWSIIAQSTMLSRIHAPGHQAQRIWTDGWDGYPAARARLLDTCKANTSLHPVLIGGDVHLNVIASIDNVATEFCGTSISSQTNWHPEREPTFYADNPQVQYLNSDQRGYALCDVTAKLWTTTLMGVDDIKRADSATKAIAQFAVERGNKTPTKV